MTSEASQLSPGATIASRYRVDELLTPDPTRPTYLGTDEQGDGRRVVLFELDAHDANGLGPVVGLEHAHLATLLELVPTGERVVLVAQHVAGQTLEELLAEIGHKTPLDAVRSALRVADALSHIHDAGGVHGCVRAAAVVIQPEGRPAPVLGFSTPQPAPSPFRCPERGATDPPSVADDAWAIGAMFFEMLTGTAPPAEGVTSEDELEQLGILDPVLRAVVLHSLQADREKRSPDLRAIKRELARWFVDHAGDETGSHGAHSGSLPPPLPPGGPSSAPPPGHVPAVASSMPPARSSSTRRLIPLFAVGAIVFGLGAAWAVSAVRSRPKVVEVPVQPSASAASPASSKSEIDLSEVSVNGQKETLTDDKTASCVAGYLPKNAFKDTPDFSWLCADTDPRDGAGKLRVALVKSSPGGGVSDAMKLYSRLGWYDMAAFAVLRSGCCTDAKSLSLPDPAKDCERVDQALDKLGHSIAASRGHEEELAAFARATDCEAKANRASLYRQKSAPTSAEQAAFEEFVKQLQTP